MITPNPDCQAGKHAACSGDAWDDNADALAACPCLCHTTPAPQAEEPTPPANPFADHLVDVYEARIKCKCGVLITAGSLMEAFAEHFEHQEAATAPATESDS